MVSFGPSVVPPSPPPPPDTFKVNISALSPVIDYFAGIEEEFGRFFFLFFYGISIIYRFFFFSFRFLLSSRLGGGKDL